MPSAYINPAKMKAALHNAEDIGSKDGKTPVFPCVAIVLGESSLTAYGRSHFCVGWSFTDRLVRAEAHNTVLIEHGEAHELGMEVGKTSGAKDAQVSVEIVNDRIGNRLVVEYGNATICDLAGIEPAEGDIASINSELELLDGAEPGSVSMFSINPEVIKRFTKVRGVNPVIDMLPVRPGNTVLVKVGDGFIGAFEALDRDRIENRELLFRTEDAPAPAPDYVPPEPEPEPEEPAFELIGTYDREPESEGDSHADFLTEEDYYAAMFAELEEE